MLVRSFAIESLKNYIKNSNFIQANTIRHLIAILLLSPSPPPPPDRLCRRHRRVRVVCKYKPSNTCYMLQITIKHAKSSPSLQKTRPSFKYDFKLDLLCRIEKKINSKEETPTKMCGTKIKRRRKIGFWCRWKKDSRKILCMSMCNVYTVYA